MSVADSIEFAARRAGFVVVFVVDAAEWWAYDTAGRTRLGPYKSRTHLAVECRPVFEEVADGAPATD